MKHIIRTIINNIFAIWLTSALMPGLSLNGDWRLILFAGLVLGALVVFVKPLVKILFLPVNLLTLGLLSWGVNVIVIFLLTLIVPDVQIVPWTFQGLSLGSFIITSFKINYFFSLIISTFLITFIANFLQDLNEE